MENYKELSIFLLCLLVGVAVSRYVDDEAGSKGEVLQPIVSQTRQRRMCAELCKSGLGGDPCGEGCVDLIPDDLPVQYLDGHEENTSSASTRHDMCDVLCENNLGYPLCQCNTTQTLNTKANFFEVCRAFCIRHNYKIYGCQTCSLYQKGSSGSTLILNESSDVGGRVAPNWRLWCSQKCSQNDGGSACACDYLPTK